MCMNSTIISYSLFEQHFEAQQKLNDGLIITIPLEESIDSLSRFCFEEENLEICNLEAINNKIFIEFVAHKIAPFVKFMTLIFNFGYKINFVTQFKINMDREINEKLSFETFKNELNQHNVERVHTKYIIEIEAVHDMTIKINDEFLYFVADERFINEILNEGINTKYGKILKAYPTKISLVRSITDAKLLIKDKKIYYSRNHNLENKDKFNKNKIILANFVLLQINNTNLNNKFYKYKDFDDSTVYTYDNIDSERIKVLDENFKYDN